MRASANMKNVTFIEFDIYIERHHSEINHEFEILYLGNSVR